MCRITLLFLALSRTSVRDYVPAEATAKHSVKGKHGGNVLLQPQPDTLAPVPWAGYVGDQKKYRVGQVLCETVWPESGQAQRECPRYIARQQLQQLEQLGYQLRSSFEIEFMLFDKETKRPLFKNGNFYNTTIWDQHEGIMLEIGEALRDMGVGFESSHVEVSPGQFEITVTAELGIKAADDAFLIREAIRQIFQRRLPGVQTVFMAKPGVLSYGNALHFNCSLEKKNGVDNLFYDPDDSHKLSTVARRWLAGQVKHVGAMLALVCPTFNCFRPLHVPYQPDLANWGVNNRLATFRISNQSPKSTRIESRMPSGVANPYFVLATSVAAGIHGLTQNLSCPKDMDPNAARLPDNLLEALEELERDGIVVKALGKELVDCYCMMKRNEELTTLGGSSYLTDTDSSQIRKEWDYYKDL